jgi:hypothetical protein
MNLRFKILKALGFFKNKKYVEIEVIQTNGVGYIMEVPIDKVNEELDKLKVDQKKYDIQSYKVIC